MAYLHSEPNVIIHRDLKPRLVGGLMLRIEYNVISFEPLKCCMDSLLGLCMMINVVSLQECSTCQ